jgi:hypothetical protein
VAPCAWPISYSGCGSCAPLDALSAADKARVEEMATAYLWNWTGQKLGVCPMVLRPCRSDCGSGESTFDGYGPRTSGYLGRQGAPPHPSPALVNGAWIGAQCGTCGSGACSCLAPTTLRLPGPVAGVAAVVVDGVTLAPTKYRVDPGDLLVRTDGWSWPTCQDFTKDSTQSGTWQVTYDRGEVVPVGGQIAAGVLACELAKAWCNDGSCKLPQRLQTVSRQGVTIVVPDPLDTDTGATGIWLIDSWVASVTLPKRGAAVYSVDVPVGSRGRLGPA